MSEVWIHSNRRAILLGLVFPVLVFASGLAAIAIGRYPGANTLWSLFGGSLVAGAGIMVGVLLYLAKQPRVAWAGDSLLLFLRATEPLSVPIDAVECFFAGQAEGMLRGANGRDTEVATVIIRLAEAAREWHHRDVKPAFGMWCEGYITIRGTWCEPITPELMRRLNQRLVEVQRGRKSRLVEIPQ